MKDTSWAHALEVTADGSGLVGHAGAVLLRQLADRLGLTAALETALTVKGTFPQLSRGMVLVSTAVAIALGATAMADIEVLGQLAPVLGPAPSDSTVRRVLDLATDRTLTRIAQARARIRKHAWALIAATGRGFPWIAVAGKTLEGWLVIDMDATLVTACSDKENARPTWKMGYGFHPLAAWCINTRECLDMLLRPGNAGSNTFEDHREVLTAALKQVPASFRRRILVRIDGAGASHKLIEHLLTLTAKRRTLLFTCGWTILDADEQAIASLPETAWQPGLLQDGGLEDDKDCAEITHLMARAGIWPPGLRFIARRVKPSRRHKKKMTAFEKKTGWKYSITCTNIGHTGMADVPGSQHPQFIDVLQRDHATVETDGVRTAKAMGLRNLPSRAYQVNKGWVLAANIAADLTAWARLLGLHDQEELRDATPGTLRYRLWSIPARLVRHARKRILKISPDWPWKQAFLTCWQRVCALPAPS
ncbi:MAG: IS1380 family transposase [Streptosporangiaceae bacterium]